MAKQNEVLQDLAKFTVGILGKDKLIGTGFAVSMDGKIVTCAHVVEAALKNPYRESVSREIMVYFPQLDEDHAAEVLPCFGEEADDVVVLQLKNKTMPLPPENLAILGTGNEATGHNFRALGYLRMKGADDNLYPALGQIVGEILPGRSKKKTKRHAREIMLQSQQIDKGMSGGAVLDEESNLIVGVVSHTYNSPSAKNRDSSKAVNAHVLKLPPLLLQLHESNPLKAGQRPNQEAPDNTPAPIGNKLNFAPAVLGEWVGREELLANIERFYQDDNKRLVGMVGFGGEGKTSLARKWLESFMQQHPTIPVFWWSFYENRDSDQFLSAFLTFLGGEALSRETNSGTAKANLIGSYLGKHQVLFVLDGFEVMQHEDGKDFGKVRNRDLLDMLKYAALNDRKSFGLITTRAPMLELQPYSTYQHLDINRLSEADGRALLTEIGVKGSDEAMDKLINAWEGHALTLSLLGKYLAEKFEGDISHVKDIPEPKPDEPFYARVTKVLTRYDKFMTEADRAFMQIFSAFRLPISPDAFGRVFLANTGSKINAPLVDMSFWELKTLVDGLIKRGLLRQSGEGDKALYSTHPLIRAHYAQSLQDDKETHRAIAEHYQANAPEEEIDESQMERFKELMRQQGLAYRSDDEVRELMRHNKWFRTPSLQELQPYIEIVHHLCQTGAYDEALNIHWERTYKETERVIIHKLGAYETNLTIMLGFFPVGDSNQDPLVSNVSVKRFILNELAFCLQNLGRMAEAVPFYQRQNRIAEGMQDWRNASGGYQSLSELSLHLGNFSEAQSYTQQALGFAQKMTEGDDERKDSEMRSLTWLAWAKAQTGKMEGEEGALALFQAAEKLEKELDNTKQYLLTGRGIQHARSLQRHGDLAYARIITEVNLSICESGKWLFLVSRCQRVLGDLDAQEKALSNAQKHYDESIRLALMIDKLDTRIEAWLGRGLFYAKHLKKGQDALSDLEQAMKPILDSGYRIYEADCRVAFAWAYKHLPNPDIAKAKQEAERALAMSIEMGYAWGKEDAEEVLKALEA